MAFARVIVDIASSQVDKIFDYNIPSEFEVRRGMRVLVPFGARVIEGIVVDVCDKTEVTGHKIKNIIKPIENFRVITEDQFKLSEFLKEQYNIGLSDSFRLFLPSQMRSGKIKDLVKKEVTIKDETKAKEYLSKLRANAKSQIGAIYYLLEKGKVYLTELNQKFGSSAITKLKNENIVNIEEKVVFRSPYKSIDNSQSSQVVLTPLQEQVASTVSNKVGFYLLHGVTGSGKTEVYMNIIKNVLAGGKTAIMLVPEISLTPQVLSNFRSRFGASVAILHSGLSAGERFDEWKRILMGDAKIVVGARSAIFAPVSNLGVIIIDEEHDGSYISESNPRYNTIEVAEFRAKIANCSLVLGSATPSLESYVKALKGEYYLLEMKQRVNRKPLPPLLIVDMAKEIREGNTGIFSRELEERLRKTISEGNQAIIFLNRRGYASFLMCKDCGWVAKCTDCDVSLVYHRSENVLKCHYCGNRYKVFNVCPNCGGTNLKQGALGTQKVVEELNNLFPDVKVLRMDNDTTQNKDSHLKILSEFRSGKAQILVGTQMIAKGHDFPQVTLVGIVDADVSLHQTSYKACEKTFQLITQVAGRAGRADKQGEIVLQTYSPRHYVYRLASNYDYTAFFKKEANTREVTNFPPFATIFRILVTAENEEVVREKTKVLYEQMQKYQRENTNDIIYLGVMKSPIGKIQNKFRYQILIRATNKGEFSLRKYIYSVLDQNKSADCLCFVEINPQNLS